MDPWYADGIRFECTLCGNCCTGQPGHVWVTEEEQHSLAANLGIPIEKFRKRYTRLVGDRISLLEKPNRDCIFLTDDHRCAVHAIKPRQCLAFPFWPRNLESREAWAETALRCPGIGTGPLVSAADVTVLGDEQTPREALWELMWRRRSE